MQARKPLLRGTGHQGDDTHSKINVNPVQPGSKTQCPGPAAPRGWEGRRLSSPMASHRPGPFPAPRRRWGPNSAVPEPQAPELGCRGPRKGDCLWGTGATAEPEPQHRNGFCQGPGVCGALPWRRDHRVGRPQRPSQGSKGSTGEEGRRQVTDTVPGDRHRPGRRASAASVLAGRGTSGLFPLGRQRRGSATWASAQGCDAASAGTRAGGQETATKAHEFTARACPSRSPGKPVSEAGP